MRLRVLVLALVGAIFAVAPAANASIYWFHQVTEPGAGNPSYWIGRAGITGALPQEDFFRAGPVFSHTGLATNGEHLYWGMSVPGENAVVTTTIARVKSDSSEPEPEFVALASEFELAAVAADKTHVYWAAGVNVRARPSGPAGVIGRAALDRSTVEETLIPLDTIPCGLAVREDYLYWSSGGSIGRARLDGTGVEADFVRLSRSDDVCGLAISAKHVYWENRTNGRGGSAAVGRARRDGSRVEERFIGLPGKVLCGVAVDPANVYWATRTGLGRADLDGSALTRRYLEWPTCGVAVDASEGLAPDAEPGRPVFDTRSGTALLPVTVTGAGGTVTLSGKGVKTVKTDVRTPRTVRLRVTPVGAARRSLARTGRAEVRIKVLYMPYANARAVTEFVALTLRMRG